MTESVATVDTEALHRQLQGLFQGDLISIGAVSLIGSGSASAAALNVDAEDDGTWAAMYATHTGWYVICSQTCDIVRTTDTEPCLLICPLVTVDESTWLKRKRGPFHPRQFAYPEDSRIQLEPGQFVVADARYMTSMLKTNLLNGEIDTRRPLSAQQRDDLRAWLGRRFAREAHDDMVQDHVLNNAAVVVDRLIEQYRERKGSARAEAQLAGVAHSWYLSGNDKLVTFHLVLEESLCKESMFWNADGGDGYGEFKEEAVESAERKLTKAISARLPKDAGYLVKVVAENIASIPLSEYRTWTAWQRR